MKVQEFLEPFSNNSIFKIRGELHSVHEIVDTYGDFEVVRVESLPDSPHFKLIVDEATCDCYEITNEKHYLTEYEKGYYCEKRDEKLDYITKEVSRCLGTAEKETCTCGGYKSRCDFYKKEFKEELDND